MSRRASKPKARAARPRHRTPAELDCRINLVGGLITKLRDHLLMTEAEYDELVRERNRLEREAA